MKNHPVNNDYVQNLVEGLINEADYAEDTGLNRAQNPNYRRQLARKLRKTRNAETVGGAIESAEDTTAPVKAGQSTVSDLNKKAFMSNPAAQDSMRRGAETIASKKKVVESKQTVYQSADKPENKSYLTKDVKLDKFPIEKKEKEKVDEDIDSRILKKIEDAGGGKEYEKKRSEYSKKVGDKKRKSSEEK